MSVGRCIFLHHYKTMQVKLCSLKLMVFPLTQSMVILYKINNKKKLSQPSLILMNGGSMPGSDGFLSTLKHLSS